MSMAMRNIGLIIMREFKERVYKKSFIITTLLMPLLMVVISVGLTLVSGLIPANAAAKKDPVIALRTE